ncbi:MAG TPA: agmatinase family protein [Myxococcota bacterium]|nr:agmatinase family protein [Myxococcota bacterium]HRY95768.1 agmatinase family protein [Myxococcota bacterium]HSA20535.1 agmatinase family protein [Myxococcota bacterium]
MAHFDPDAAARPGSGVFGLPTLPAEARVVLIPVPFDATTSYRAGTAEGPAAILAASRQVELFLPELGCPYTAGIAMLPEPAEVRAWSLAARRAAEPVIAAGGVEAAAPGSPEAEHLAAQAREVDGACEAVRAWVGELAHRLLAEGRMPVVVGGEHSVPLGAIEAYAERYPGLGLLHVDAHADLRQAFEGFAFSHASIMRNVCARAPGIARLVQVGVRDLGQEELAFARAQPQRVCMHLDTDLAARRMQGEPWSRQVERIVADLPERVYLSFDIDGLEPGLCPGTGTPVPGGLGFHEALALVSGLVQSGRRLVGFDLCEVAPRAGDDWDGNVGARLLYRLIGWALRSQGLLPAP